MKFNKKLIILLVFLLGAVIFASSAFADIVLGSSYNSLKESVKTTTAKLTDEVDNFSVDMSLVLKVDDEIILEEKTITKLDTVNQAEETRGTSFEKGEKRENYSYNDLNQTIYKDMEDGSYTVIERQNSNNERKIFENPFDNEEAKDAEKILDAFVGSLENVIQIEESANRKMYIGNLGDEEIPPLINAISSFALKYSVFDGYKAERLSVPLPKSNIYVIDTSGKAIENEEGTLESGIFTASMSAQDDKGNEHIYTLEFSIDINDINSTVLAAPNLDGQEVTYSTEGVEFDEKYIGKYKNDIVKEEKNSFVKYGERFVEIKSVKDGNIKGRYYEVYNEGHEPDMVRDFEFTSTIDESNYSVILSYKDHEGQKKNGVMQRSNMYDINLMFDVTIDKENGGYSTVYYDADYNSEFVRIFE